MGKGKRNKRSRKAVRRYIEEGVGRPMGKRGAEKRENVMCPKHKTKMHGVDTRFGWKYMCSEHGCDMVAWNDSDPANQETRGLRQALASVIKEEMEKPQRSAACIDVVTQVKLAGGIGKLPAAACRMCIDRLGHTLLDTPLEKESFEPAPRPQKQLTEPAFTGAGREMDLD